MPILLRILLAVLAGASILGARLATRQCLSREPMAAAASETSYRSSTLPETRRL